jgi:hypothetical protein
MNITALVFKKFAFSNLIFLFSFAWLSLAWASSPLANRPDWNFGAHIGVHRSGDSFNLEVSSPALSDYTSADIPQSTHLTFHLGFNNTYNGIEKTSGRSAVNQSFQLVSFLESQTRSSDFPIQVWSRIGPGIHALPSAAYKSSTAVGLHVGLGADFAFQEDRKDNLFGSSTPCLSLGVGGLFGLPKAENLVGEPNLLTGFSVQVGLRNHF